MQDALAEVDALDDLHVVHGLEPAGDLAGHVAAVEAHPGGEVLGGGVELVQVVLPLVEVVAHLLVRHGDRAAAAAVAVPVLGGGGQLRGGVPVRRCMLTIALARLGCAETIVRDLVGVGLDAHLLVERDLPQLGDQAGVVL